MGKLMNLSGQCLCGAVRYTFSGEPQFVFLCHCRDCQRSGGSLTHFGVMVAESGFNRHGTVSAYTKDGDAGRKITREFCPICGSGINNRLEVAPGMIVIKGGTLDNPNRVTPTFELYARSKQLSFAAEPALICFAKGMAVDPRELLWKAL